MKKVLVVAAALAAMILLCGCDDSPTTVYLEPGLKMEDVDLTDFGTFITYRPMREGECAEEHVYQGRNRVGTLRGALIIIEQDDHSEEP